MRTRSCAWPGWTALSASLIFAFAVGTASVRLVVRRFLDDLDVVDVRLAHPRRGDLDELGALAHRLDAVAAHVAHARAQAAHQLVDHPRDRALVRDPAFDACGHELVRVRARLPESGARC